MPLSIVVTAGHTFPAGVPVTLAALRQGALPTITITGSVANADLVDGAVTPVKVTPGAYWWAKDTGATDAYAVTFAPAVPALVDGLILSFKPNTTCTGASSFSPNGLTAYPIKKHGGQMNTQDGDIRAKSQVDLRLCINEVDVTLSYWELLSIVGVPPRFWPMQPASAYSAGLGGLTPDTKAGEQASLLRGDGTWEDPTARINTLIAAATLTGTNRVYQQQQFI